VAVILVMLIKGKLVVDPQTDQQGNSHSHRQTADIYQGITFGFKEVSPSDFKIAF
jgi:hypothetical protein